MPLNSSGPLSFGGSTVGQSINLELGVSATALASINSTNFRSLAGVASGQISISNFYGKASIDGLPAVFATGNITTPTVTQTTAEFTWVVPSGVTAISALCIGAGGGGGST
jgi:hypothetical protein